MHAAKFPSEEGPGTSVFYKDAAGDIFHTYSAYARGLDMMSARGCASSGKSYRNPGCTTAAWRRHIALAVPVVVCEPTPS